MAINKQNAIDLRLSGLTLQQVAVQLGCSIDWCKRNLGGVAKHTKDSLLIDEVRRIGRTSAGITKTEVFKLVKQAYPKLPAQDLTEKVSAIKKAARRGCKEVTIRPDWMPTDHSKASLETMISMGQEVFEFMHFLAQKYRQEFGLDASYQRGIVYELSKLSAGENNKLMPMGLVKYGSHLEGIAVALDERQQQKISPGSEECTDTHTRTESINRVTEPNIAQPLVLEETEIPY